MKSKVLYFTVFAAGVAVGAAGAWKYLKDKCEARLQEEIESIIEDGNPIEVKCHFCNTAYHFGIDDLKLIKK